MSQIVEDMYPAEIVLPMKAELVDNGFTDLTTAAEVSNVVNTNGTTMVVINSVCGCAAGACRPGVLMAVANATKTRSYHNSICRIRYRGSQSGKSITYALSTFFTSYCFVQRRQIGKYGRKTSD